MISELRSLHDKEKSLLMEENKKLSVELERSVEVSTRLQSDRRNLEEEYSDLQVYNDSIYLYIKGKMLIVIIDYLSSNYHFINVP